MTDYSPGKPILIAHRGASGYLPEHTLAAYRIAIEQGADFIEPDLVSTADGVFIAPRERDRRYHGCRFPSGFATRRTIRHIDGEPVTGWFAEDFSLGLPRSATALGARGRAPASGYRSAR